MMRVMRENLRWVFWVLVVAFVGWMVFDVGMGLTGQGQYDAGDLLKINGE